MLITLRATTLPASSSSVTLSPTELVIRHHWEHESSLRRYTITRDTSEGAGSRTVTHAEVVSAPHMLQA